MAKKTWINNWNKWKTEQINQSIRAPVYSHLPDYLTTDNFSCVLQATGYNKNTSP